MLGALNEYVRSVAVVSVIVSIVMAIAPKGAARAVVGVVAGLVMIIIIITPLTKLKKADFGEFSLDLSERIVSGDEKLIAEQDNLLKELIVEKTSAYILAKAQAFGIDCEVIVTLDDSSPPLPETAVIKTGIPYDPLFEKEMSMFLAFDCGITRENQSFLWRM